MVEMSRLGRPEPTPQDPRPRPGTPDVLTVAAVVPSAATAGSTLRFVVTLSNPTRTTVRLTPCPRYGEGVFTNAGHVERWYRLDCDTVSLIGPSTSVRYAMQLRVPAAAGGMAKFWWQLAAPTVPTRAGAITITRS
jgi:hypothetical protein